ncbi:GntR family transcriptional regulator [Bacillus sp. T33-2]|uniref:GntR family transcriptional regulator n=1 Tax=Bacillus sp. T33-2 TaxID=2054168 RepID=UPI000C778753|nr:GntR family transcriptional regulator [Bacillus sp. T33-2]PLR95791.1 hypothetical protein CVD19_13750 [Bacillus sp. T33-2]
MTTIKFLAISNQINKDYIMKNDRSTKRLPGEKELSEQYGVSRETIRKALNELIQHGKIYSIQGSGYYIKQASLTLKNSLNYLSSITEMIRDFNLSENDMNTKMHVDKASEEARQLLDLNEDDDVYILNRIRTANFEPVVYSINVLPLKLVGKEFEQYYFKGSLSKFLKDFYQYEFTEAITEIQAVTAADEVSDVFAGNHYPLLKFIQTHYTIEGKPILLSYDYMRNDVIRFYVKRNKQIKGR